MQKRTLSPGTGLHACAGNAKRPKSGKHSYGEAKPNEQYTVGWICGNSTEFIAARSLLDEKHEGPDFVAKHDNNNYALGKIGKHSVVIAVIAKGEYGAPYAASVARDMLSTFLNIRIGLLVGIGGGAPTSKHQIHLGDVVVGISPPGKDSVYQYDSGVTIQGRGFVQQKVLNQPPSLLLNAVSGLEAQYGLEGHNIEASIESAIQKYPKLRKKYSRPRPETDRLYKSNIVHRLGEDSDCLINCGQGPACIQGRAERNEDDENPMIHYGRIASANTLMADAVVRDKLATSEDILCFETEAAGLMNHFPCLVIRGICDYADSHKNTEWHGYAAMTAAAYAKDLLRLIAPTKITDAERISDMFSSLNDTARDHLGVALEQLDIQKDLRKEQFTRREQECHHLFLRTDGKSAVTYEWYKERIEKRIPGTCTWLLEHDRYGAWLKQESGPLLVTADPGCGKSVLAKYLIDECLPQSATVCYFFFKDQDQNTIQQALCAILHQLFVHKPSLIKHAMEDFEKKGQGVAQSVESMWKILEDATSNPDAGCVIIVLDALDECTEVDFAHLMRRLDQQFGKESLAQKKLRYLLTCRPYERILSGFDRLFEVFPSIHIPGEDESETISQEINLVIRHRVSQLSRKKSLSKDLRDHLEKNLLQTDHRTYLWIYLVFDYLETNGFKKTESGIEESIKRLPKSVNEAYEQILSKSRGDAMVRKALSIVLVAERPLSLREMNVALNIHDSISSSGDMELESDEDFQFRLKSWCGLFISIHHEKIYFLHQTAREFLLAESNLAEENLSISNSRWQHSITALQGQNTMAEACVAILCLIGSEFCPKVLQLAPYLYSRYSAYYWASHFERSSFNELGINHPSILNLYEKVCEGDRLQQALYLQPGRRSGIHLASYFGHVSSVKIMLANGADPEKLDDGVTPLMVAASQGYHKVVELLLNKGANIETADNTCHTALFCAVMNERVATTKLLLDSGANIETRDSEGYTPLARAIIYGKKECIHLLLDHGANIEAKDSKGHTPLAQAIIYGKKESIHLLLDYGANIEIRDSGGNTPLILAIIHKQNEAITTLLDRGANLESTDKYGNTPLHRAARDKSKVPLALLIKAGANLESTDEYGNTPLFHAVTLGSLENIRLLLDTGARKDARNFFEHTPLIYAKNIIMHDDRDERVRLLEEMETRIPSED